MGKKRHLDNHLYLSDINLLNTETTSLITKTSEKDGVDRRSATALYHANNLSVFGGVAQLVRAAES